MQVLPCLLGAVSALTLALPLDAQTKLVVPAAPAAATGNGANSYPWNRRTSQIRFQQMYAASNFAAIKMPILIQRLRFRASDSYATTSTWTGGTYNGARISMSTAATVHTAISTTFAANHGTDLKQVFPAPGGTNLGAIKVTAGAGTGTGVPGIWYVDVPLSQTFLFDPTKNKDLVVDIQLNGSWTGGTSASTANYSGTAASAQGSRAYNTSSWQATTASGSTTNYTLATEFTYVPAKGLYASFTASPTTGGQNLKVTFKDTSYSSDPAGIQSWAWDFDGDAKVDSTLQNPPAFTFKCGKYSPSLTVTDKVHKPSTQVQKDLIRAALVKADFAVVGATRGLAPFKVSFTDKSAGPVAVRTWDFDGDGKVDSTAPNPTFTYTTNGTYDVKLTVIGPCTQDSVTKKGLITVGEACLTTLFADNNGGSAGWGNAFDVDVKNSSGLKITSMDVNSSSAVNSTVSIDVYTTPKTYVGNEGNAAVWTKVASGSGPGKGRGVPTPINISDFFLAPGKYGMWVHYVSGSVAYTNGTATNNFYSNADLALRLGISRAGLFSGTLFNPRIWNGRICYMDKTKAASGAYGFGCLGTNSKMPQLSLSADPVIGTTVKLNVTNMVNVPTGQALMFIGLKRVQTDLAFIGMPKCFLFNDALVTLGFVNVNGSASLPGPIPTSSSVVGAQAFIQAANADKGANLLGVAATPGVAIRIGVK
ncbi:MAG: PKD domain-containing protein [Planctomycetota bacterium]|jgi:PKD repeat protein